MKEISNVMKVNVHGSCVSRDIFHMGDSIQVNQYCFRSNLVASVMEPADIFEDYEELLIPGQPEFPNNAVEKSTIPRLIEAEGDFLVVDLFDFCQPVACTEKTTFSTYDGLFFSTRAYANHQSRIKNLNFFGIPTCLWYSYVDYYWRAMQERYGTEGIILVKLRCTDLYCTKNKHIKKIPDHPFPCGDAKLNDDLEKLENYIIEKYRPYVIDISKYFIADENHNPDVTPVHFEKEFIKNSWDILEHIVKKRPEKRWFEEISTNTVSKILGRQISDAEFLTVWENQEHQFHSCSFMDDILKLCSQEEILKNRKWLAWLYEEAEDISDKVRNWSEMEFSLEPYVQFVKKVQASIKNEFEKKYCQLLEERLHYLSLDFEDLFAQFEKKLEEEDLAWIVMLQCLAMKNPKEERIQFYQLLYYDAIKEKAAIFNLTNMKKSPEHE